MKIYPKQSTWSNTSSSIGIHFSWYFLSLIVNVAISFIKSPIYTDLFSPNEFGLYSLVLISFTIFSTFSPSRLCAFATHLGVLSLSFVSFSPPIEREAQSHNDKPGNGELGLGEQQIHRKQCCQHDVQRRQ